MGLVKALFTGSGKPPWQYTRLQLCRDIYHCTPAELARQDWQTVLEDLAMLEAEHQVRKATAKGE